MEDGRKEVGDRALACLGAYHRELEAYGHLAEACQGKDEGIAS